MKDDFSLPVVHIDTVPVPVFLIVRFTWMSKVRGTSSMLVMFWSDLHFSDLVLAVGAENGQLFFLILWQLLRHGGSCADGEITSFHKTKAPKRTSLKVVNLHVTS